MAVFFSYLIVLQTVHGTERDRASEFVGRTIASGEGDLALFGQPAYQRLKISILPGAGLFVPELHPVPNIIWKRQSANRMMHVLD